jgi:hypothetical protein
MQGRRRNQARRGEIRAEIGENGADHARDYAACQVKTGFAAPEIAESRTNG